MAKFLYLYFGGKQPESPEAGKKVMEAWMAWFGQVGSKIVDRGAPIGPRKSIGGGAASSAGGYSIVDAGSLDEAIDEVSSAPRQWRFHRSLRDRLNVVARGKLIQRGPISVYTYNCLDARVEEDPAS